MHRKLHRTLEIAMNRFFAELMESVRQMNEILRNEHQLQSFPSSPTTNKICPRPTGQPAMNLAPNLPDDPTLHQLIHLLHEELGLPERKAISLNTSINFDLGCNGADAQHLIETLEERFAIYFEDFDSYRYFQPDGYDVNLKRKTKGRGEKVPLTLGMLYRAIKAQRWDTEEMERP
jgi:hypothetical protein